MTIGEKLQRAREDKGMSLMELQGETKIQLRYLEAIENDNFKSLPGEYNTKLFLRSYARAVDLDPNEIIREYQGEPINEHIEEYNKTVTRGSRTDQYQSTQKKQSKTKRLVPLIVLFLVFMVIIGSVSYAFVKEHNRFAANSDVKTEYSVEDNKQDQPTKSEVKTQSSARENTQTSKPKVTKTQKPKRKQMTIKYTSSQVGRVTVDVKNIKDKATLVLTGTQGRCWVGAVTNMNQSLYQGVVEFNQNETLNIPTQAKSLSVQLGNAPMLTMKLNGKKIEIPNNMQSKQQVVTFNLDYQS